MRGSLNGGMLTTPQYDTLIELLRRRMSVRRLKPDPLPEGAIEKILEAGRWAMSGANGQPWEYIVVMDPNIKQKLFDHYQKELDCDYNLDFKYTIDAITAYHAGCDTICTTRF